MSAESIGIDDSVVLVLFCADVNFIVNNRVTAAIIFVNMMFFSVKFSSCRYMSSYTLTLFIGVIICHKSTIFYAV